MNMQKSGIQCLLLDDGLRGVEEVANGLSWHERFTNGSVYRIVRIEAVAEDILKILSPTNPKLFNAFSSALYATLRGLACEPVVVGFKSVEVCYRTGLNVGVNSDDLSGVERSIVTTVSSWKNAGGSDVLRLADKALNDFVVCVALSIAAEFNKPDEFQFHTGVGGAEPIDILAEAANLFMVRRG